MPAADKAYESLLYLDYEQPLRLVPAGAALLRRLGHGRDGAGAHDAGLPARGVQVSARADLGRRRVPARLHDGHVLQRADAALGSGCLLGPRGRRVDGRPRAGDRAVGRRPAAGRPDHRRRFAQPLLRAARVRHSRRAAVLPGGAPLAGAAVRHQRAAGARPGRRSADLRRRVSRRARSRASRSSAMRC